MSFLYLPKIYNNNIQISLQYKKKINDSSNNDTDNVFISKSLNIHLNEIKKV